MHYRGWWRWQGNILVICQQPNRASVLSGPVPSSNRSAQRENSCQTNKRRRLLGDLTKPLPAHFQSTLGHVWSRIASKIATNVWGAGRCHVTGRGFSPALVTVGCVVASALPIIGEESRTTLRSTGVRQCSSSHHNWQLACAREAVGRLLCRLFYG